MVPVKPNRIGSRRHVSGCLTSAAISSATREAAAVHVGARFPKSPHRSKTYCPQTTNPVRNGANGLLGSTTMVMQRNFKQLSGITRLDFSSK